MQYCMDVVVEGIRLTTQESSQLYLTTIITTAEIWQKSKDGDYIYHRKYRKSSKKCDVTATLESKKYEYIPPLLKAIHAERSTSSYTTKSKPQAPDSHPTKLQSTIAHTIPDTTIVLVKNKLSRYK